MNLEHEMQKLEALRTKRDAVSGAIAEARNAAVRCTREIGEARVAGVLDPEQNPAKAVEARCAKLERELKVAQSEIEKATPELSALGAAINHLEREIVPKRHAERLNKQAEFRERYTAIARRKLEAANTLAALSAEEKFIFDSASSEFPKDELCEGQAVVMRFAGLAPIWDPAWIDYGQGSRRDLVVGAVWEFDRSLVDPTDHVALAKQHQEDYRRAESERIERERNNRKWGRPTPKLPGHQYVTVRHPLGLPI
jgi:hypothetical protein